MFLEIDNPLTSHKNSNHSYTNTVYQTNLSTQTHTQTNQHQSGLQTQSLNALTNSDQSISRDQESKKALQFSQHIDITTLATHNVRESHLKQIKIIF